MQRSVRVARVPNERHPATCAKHPVELGNRHVVPEPVESLSDRDRVDAPLGEWYGLGRAAQHFGSRRGALQLRTHSVTRLDCDDTGARLQESTGELAGAGAEVEHGSARPQVEPI